MPPNMAVMDQREETILRGSEVPTESAPGEELKLDEVDKRLDCGPERMEKFSL